MIFKIFFTWWNKQTFGTFLKTLFFGRYVGTDESGNKYYKSKKDERWVIYANKIEATKITSDWYLWMHHTIDKIPESKEKKYLWQKKHLLTKRQKLFGILRKEMDFQPILLLLKTERKILLILTQ